MKPWQVGDRIRFADEVRPYTVQAVSLSGRYLACTKPFAARRTVLYTVVDLVNNVRGVDDSIGNSLGYETREECARALDLFESGQFGYLKAAATDSTQVAAFGGPGTMKDQTLEMRTLIAKCEGCGREEGERTTDRRRLYAFPPQWMQWGCSRYPPLGRGTRLAIWCPKCRRDERSEYARC